MRGGEGKQLGKPEEERGEIRANDEQKVAVSMLPSESSNQRD